MRIAISTGGGDAPGLNAVIRGAVLAAIHRGWECVGIRRGYDGLLDEDRVVTLDVNAVRGVTHLGGTILGSTNRGDPFRWRERLPDGSWIERDRTDELIAAFRTKGIDALIAIGGDGSLRIAHRLFEKGIPVVGVPKTIDNDVGGTVSTFGFDTAVQTATDAIDKLHSTAESHERVMVVEVMGRHTGWIAVMSGIAGGADVILIPEHPISIDEACDDIRRRHERGKDFSIVVVSEGYELEGLDDRGEVDEFGHERLSQRGVGEALAREIEARTGFETRVTVLGHVQRGGSPTPRDRVLATRYGLKAADLVHEGRFGRMAALHGDSVVDVSLEDATAELKTVPPEWYEVARAFFG